MPVTVHLSVPEIKQLRDNSCWNAAALMVLAYHEIGPQQLLPDLWEADEGISEHTIRKLAEVAGLRSAGLTRHPCPPEQFMTVLRGFGPIWMAGEYFGRRHVIVLTGCDSDGRIWYLDPDPRVEGEQTDEIDWLNDCALPEFTLVRDRAVMGPLEPPPPPRLAR